MTADRRSLLARCSQTRRRPGAGPACTSLSVEDLACWAADLAARPCGQRRLDALSGALAQDLEALFLFLAGSAGRQIEESACASALAVGLDEVVALTVLVFEHFAAGASAGSLLAERPAGAAWRFTALSCVARAAGACSAMRPIPTDPPA